MLSVHELILSLETFHLAPSWRHYSIEEAELCCTWGPTSLPVTSRQDVVRHFSAKAKNVYVLRRVWQQLRKKVAIGDGRCDVTNMCVCVSKKTLTSRVEQVFRALWLVQICSPFAWHWSLDARVGFVHPSYCQVTVNKTLLHVLGKRTRVGILLLNLSCQTDFVFLCNFTYCLFTWCWFVFHFSNISSLVIFSFRGSRLVFRIALKIISCMFGWVGSLLSAHCI